MHKTPDNSKAGVWWVITRKLHGKLGSRVLMRDLEYVVPASPPPLMLNCAV